jgi:D123
MDAEHLANFSFPRWYTLFSSVTFKSRILPLPPGFAEYLVADGIVLPDSSQAVRGVSFIWIIYDHVYWPVP